jgi:hypothetical protein
MERLLIGADKLHNGSATVLLDVIRGTLEQLGQRCRGRGVGCFDDQDDAACVRSDLAEISLQGVESAEHAFLLIDVAKLSTKNRLRFRVSQGDKGLLRRKLL